MDSRQVAAITHARRRATAEQDLTIERNRLALTVGSDDPQAVADWRDSLVHAYVGADRQVYCVACKRFAGRVFVPYDVEPETICAHCGDPCGGVQ